MYECGQRRANPNQPTKARNQPNQNRTQAKQLANAKNQRNRAQGSTGPPSIYPHVRAACVRPACRPSFPPAALRIGPLAIYVYFPEFGACGVRASPKEPAGRPWLQVLAADTEGQPPAGCPSTYSSPVRRRALPTVEVPVDQVPSAVAQRSAINNQVVIGINGV